MEEEKQRIVNAIKTNKQTKERGKNKNFTLTPHPQKPQKYKASMMRMSHANMLYSLMAQATRLHAEERQLCFFFPALMIRAADFPGTKLEMGEEQMESPPFWSASAQKKNKKTQQKTKTLRWERDWPWFKKQIIKLKWIIHQRKAVWRRSESSVPRQTFHQVHKGFILRSSVLQSVHHRHTHYAGNSKRSFIGTTSYYNYYYFPLMWLRYNWTTLRKQHHQQTSFCCFFVFKYRTLLRIYYSADVLLQQLDQIASLLRVGIALPSFFGLSCMFNWNQVSLRWFFGGIRCIFTTASVRELTGRYAAMASGDRWAYLRLSGTTRTFLAALLTALRGVSVQSCTLSETGSHPTVAALSPEGMARCLAPCFSLIQTRGLFFFFVVVFFGFVMKSKNPGKLQWAICVRGPGVYMPHLPHFLISAPWPDLDAARASEKCFFFKKIYDIINTREVYINEFFLSKITLILVYYVFAE